MPLRWLTCLFLSVETMSLRQADRLRVPAAGWDSSLMRARRISVTEASTAVIFGGQSYCAFSKTAFTVNSEPDDTVRARFHGAKPGMETDTWCGPTARFMTDGVLPT